MLEPDSKTPMFDAINAIEFSGFDEKTKAAMIAQMVLMRDKGYSNDAIVKWVDDAINGRLVVKEADNVQFNRWRNWRLWLQISD